MLAFFFTTSSVRLRCPAARRAGRVAEARVGGHGDAHNHSCREDAEDRTARRRRHTIISPSSLFTHRKRQVLLQSAGRRRERLGSGRARVLNTFQPFGALAQRAQLVYLGAEAHPLQ